MQELKKKIKSGLVDPDKGDPFDLFIASTDIRYCYYTETQKILGSTYGMLVLQDFEVGFRGYSPAATPIILRRLFSTALPVRAWFSRFMAAYSCAFPSAGVDSQLVGANH
jgi:hypothetical protein